MVQGDTLGKKEKRRPRLGKALPQVGVLFDKPFFFEQSDLLQQPTTMGHGQGHSDMVHHQQVSHLVGKPGADLAEVGVGGPFFQQVVSKDEDLRPFTVLVNILQIVGIVFVILIQVSDQFSPCLP